jgi:hypothetical protein
MLRARKYMSVHAGVNGPISIINGPMSTLASQRNLIAFADA